MSSSLPTGNDGVTRHCAAYFIHKIIGIDPGNFSSEKDEAAKETQLVGKIHLRPEVLMPLPEKFTVPSGPETGVLLLEVGYSFLPTEWGQGYGTEALIAVLSSLKTATTFLSPFTKLYVQAIVGHENPASIRVLEKAGFESLGTYAWEADPVFLAGAWRRPRVLIYGQWLIN
jgi:RimJ/RimL family protein N-acetyltransferase